jgi:hypothetical protein
VRRKTLKEFLLEQAERALLLAKSMGAVDPPIAVTRLSAAVDVTLTSAIAGWRYDTAFTPESAFFVVLSVLARSAAPRRVSQEFAYRSARGMCSPSVQTTTLCVLPVRWPYRHFPGRFDRADPELMSR